MIAGYALDRLITGVDDTDTFVTRPHTPGQLRDALTGRTFTAAHRRGKAMWCSTSGTGGSRVAGPDLGIHLGMGGLVIVTAPDGQAASGGEPNPAWTRPGAPRWNRFTVEFADGGRLVLFDKRRLGRIRLNPDIGALGPDAEQITPAEFRGVLEHGTVAVKARLLDQSKIAGIGNLLADELLWQAKVWPATPVGRLSRQDTDRIFASLRTALASALKHGGVHTGEVIGARRPGGSCPRCGAPMRHSVVGGRSTWYCSREQAAVSARPAGAR